MLDSDHAAEHLNEPARAPPPADAAAARGLAGRWCHRLKHDGGAALLAALGGIDLRGRKAGVRERHRLVTGFARNDRVSVTGFCSRGL